MFFAFNEKNAISIRVSDHQLDAFWSQLSEKYSDDGFPKIEDAYKVKSLGGGYSEISLMPSSGFINETATILGHIDIALLEQFRDNESLYKDAKEWISSIVAAGAFEPWEDYRKRTNAVRIAQGFAALAPVEGGTTPNGHWVRVTAIEADLTSRALSETFVNVWIRASFDPDKTDPDLPTPTFYLLLDDLENPTISHVTLASYKEKDMPTDGSRPRLDFIIAETGHATGFRNRNPYPTFEADIDALVKIEGLHYRPNFVGNRLDPDEVRAEFEAAQREDFDNGMSGP